MKRLLVAVLLSASLGVSAGSALATSAHVSVPAPLVGRR
jgi:hypothetical protein